jgi:hypothetical protein
LLIAHGRLGLLDQKVQLSSGWIRLDLAIPVRGLIQ